MRSESADQRFTASPSGAMESIRQTLRRMALSRGLRRCRRRILVNRRYQLKTAAMGITGMGFLVALNVILLIRFHEGTARLILEADPALQETLARAHRMEILAVVSGGALFMAGVFLAGILESRKTAGPVLNLRRRLEELRAGRLGARVLLRRHDNFPELAGSFNEMACAIRARAEGELATLGRISTQVTELLREDGRGNTPGARQIAEALRQSLEDLRRRRAQLLEP